MSSEHSVTEHQNKPSAKTTEANIEENTESNLLSFESDSESVPPVRDINTKISSLETDLNELNAELSSINASVGEGLDRLGDSDTDLNAKVSETYKRLGEIDNAYRSLMNISVKLDADILKVTKDVSDVAQQSVDGLKELEETSVEKSNDLAERNQQVVTRVDSLVENSRTTNDLLHESIKINTESVLALETKLILDIETLAATTQTNVDDIDMQLASSKARIVKMQKVDEAIVRRATTLEITASELTQKSSDMSESIQQLEDRAEDLTGKVVDLIVHTQQLQDASDKHAGLIGSLQYNLTEAGQALLALTKLETKHFRFMLASLFIVVLAIVGLTVYQNRMWQQDFVQSAQRDTVVEQELSALQTQDVSTTQALSSLGSQLNTMDETHQQELVELNSQLRQELMELDNKVTTMDDKVQTLDGRLNNNVMFDNIGSDNVIHGQKWVAEQPSNNFVIRLVTVPTKSELYEVAESYSQYLNDKLSFIRLVKGSEEAFVLLYGSYESEAVARKAFAELPNRMALTEPVLGRFKNLGL